VSDCVRVWCLRHGEAENVTTGTAGAVPTTPLTARGRRQAVDAAQELAVEPITRIYASTALRARQTAELPAATPGLHITAMPELVEVGCTADVLRAWVLEQDLGRRAADGETGHQVVARVTAAFRRSPAPTWARPSRSSATSPASPSPLDGCAPWAQGCGAHPCRTLGPSSSSGTARPGAARHGLRSRSRFHTPIDHRRPVIPIRGC
jgi:Histidine phosphatase superfamily (branch 1)